MVWAFIVVLVLGFLILCALLKWFENKDTNYDIIVSYTKDGKLVFKRVPPESRGPYPIISARDIELLLRRSRIMREIYTRINNYKYRRYGD